MQVVSAAGGSVPVCFGQVFQKGFLPAGRGLAGLQCTVKATWPDGSARTAIVATQIEAIAGAWSRLDLVEGPPAAGAALTTADLRARLVQPVSVTVSGIGEAAWSGADWDSPHRVWVSGPVMSSWIYRRPIGADAHLVAWLEVRLWRNGAVEVLPWVENGYLFVPGGRSVNANWTFSLGGVVRESLSFDLPHHCRTPLVSASRLSHWLDSDPALTVKHDALYLMATEMVPTFGVSTAESDAPVRRLPTTYVPLQQGGYASGMGTAGASEDIGLLPDWDCAYLTSGAPAVWAGLQRNAYSAGRYGIYFRDERTQQPIRFSQHPHLVVASPAITDSGTSQTNTYAEQGTGTRPPVWKNSHHPAVGYMAALVTGRFFHVETTQFAGTIPYLVNTSNDSRRDAAKGILQEKWGANQPRGAAWGVRSYLYAFLVTPDDDPLKADFRNVLSENVAFKHARHFVGTPKANRFGLLEQITDIGAGYSVPFIIPPWQGDFSVSVYGLMRCTEPGLTGTNDTKLVEFFNWHAQFIVGRCGGDGSSEYLFRDLGQYQISMARDNYPNFDTGDGPWYANWGEVWAATNAYQSMGGPKAVGDGTLRGDNGIASNSYLANAIPALAYAVRWNVAGAIEGWRRVTSAPNWNSFVAGTAGWPVFSHRPSVMPA